MTRKAAALLVLLALLFAVNTPKVLAAPPGITFFTPYAAIAVTPGETITYSIEVRNQGSQIQRFSLGVRAPEGWTTRLTSGGYKIQELAVKPGDFETVTLTVEVPLKVDQGNYQVQVLAGGTPALTLILDVTEKGIYQVELTTDQPNMEGTNRSTFTYDLKLKNSTPDTQTFSLTADTQPGWNVQFTVDGKDVTSATVDAGGQKTIRVSINPPSKVEAGTYKIPIRAETQNQRAEVVLEAVIRGTYSMNLKTPDDVLSTDIYAGGERRLTLQVENTGSAPLKRIRLSAQTPAGWSVQFDPDIIDTLAPGETRDVTATIRASEKAITGDYVVAMTASTPETDSTATFRVTVKTRLIWGVVAVGIILLVAAGLSWLIQKYGRR
ncbi:MAG: hypothetical protein KM310_08695 [Clostridiales bacterium]|nr:hypothetical protein [Clostridiales bacterium]